MYDLLVHDYCTLLHVVPVVAFPREDNTTTVRKMLRHGRELRRSEQTLSSLLTADVATSFVTVTLMLLITLAVSTQAHSQQLALVGRYVDRCGQMWLDG